MAATATTLFVGNQIFNSIDDAPFAGYVAVQDNRILAVGKDKNYQAYVGPETRVIECGDALIMPGIMDSHGHLFFTMQIDNGVNLIHSKSEEEAAAMVYEFSKTLPDDMPIVMGYDYDPARWPYTYPTKASLDRYFPDKPVIIQRIEGHGCWLNSKALEFVKIDRDTPDPPGGKIFKDENGEPTGYLDETVQHYVSMLTTAELMKNKRFAKEYVSGMIRKFNEWGITAVSDMTFDYTEPLKVLEEIQADGDLTVRFSLAVYASQLGGDWTQPHELEKKYTESFLKFTTLKFMYDGSIMSNTAELVEPYADMPDTCNLIAIDHEDMRRQMLRANEEGFRIRVHCIGDGAVRRCLDIAEECKKSGRKAERFAIAHIELIHPDDIPRFAELGVIADIHPPHVTLGCDSAADNVYPKKVGPDREKYCFNYKSLLDSGAILAAGADSPATVYDPRLGIYRGLTRRFGDDSPKEGWIPEQRLPLPALLKAYTIGSAYLDFREEELGTLEAGKKADIVVFEKSFFDLLENPVEILDDKVLYTMVDGKICYQA